MELKIGADFCYIFLNTYIFKIQIQEKEDISSKKKYYTINNKKTKVLDTL